MEYKAGETWNNKDFYNLGWHDCRVRNFAINAKEFSLIFGIDYILDKQNDKFLIAPCSLAFLNVSNLNFNINLDDSLDLIISNIERGDTVITPNNRNTQNNYRLLFEHGVISFYSTGFIQEIQKDSMWKSTMDYF